MENKYILVAFPYPSGSGLHVGHFYNYAIIDSYCNYLRYKNNNVFQPFGYDAFGLPAENYARQINGDPAIVTADNIKNFRQQITLMETLYEEILSTTDVSYQKWTQWLFTKLKEHGKAYKAYGEVNWCPSCKTVLAREQVKSDCCDRCDTIVESKKLNQWYFKTSDYAERLYNNLDKLDWPKKTVNAQREWIGKYDGYEIDFAIKNSNDIITVFTTKPETVSIVEFIVVSPDSVYAVNDKTGEYFTGKYAINPIDNRELPIWVCDYIIDGYGTGNVMGVPTDDKRDREFQQRHKLIAQVNVFTNLVEFDGTESFVRKKTKYKLRDWCVSRQRKWGCPIPLENETDTLDTFVDSSFYYIRYCDPSNENELCSLSKYKEVDLYVGGAEHACMHLIYTRFIHMFLYDIGIVPVEEPFKKVIHQGMILYNNEKMSKSKGNTIDPMIYDINALKFYLMFIAHYFDGGSWSDENFKGITRFINKFKEWMSREGTDTFDIEKFKQEIFNYTEFFKFNKVVSSFMTLLNNNKSKNLTPECRNELISLLKIYMPTVL
jgi:leucyl-tRNA synthetase